MSLTPELAIDWERGLNGVVMAVIAHLPAGARLGPREAVAIWRAWHERGRHDAISHAETAAILAGPAKGPRKERPTLRLVAIPQESTGLAGCIGIQDSTGPISGFAIIDPNGMIMPDAEANAMAAEVCRRWNAFCHIEPLLSAMLARADAMMGSDPDDPRNDACKRFDAALDDVIHAARDILGKPAPTTQVDGGAA